MAMTKQQAAAKARAAKAAKLQAQAEAGYSEASGVQPTTYVYVGSKDAVIVVIDGTRYEFRPHELVHLPNSVPFLDEHKDFRKVN
jgi:hypothetical protein